MHERRGTVAVEQAHPVVRTDPVTGRKAIFVNPVFTRRFETMTMEESAPVLRYLHEGACAQPEGGVSSSSGRILTAGVSRSSNWPERTAHRKMPAIAMTAMIEIPMRSGRTSIVVSVRS